MPDLRELRLFDSCVTLGRFMGGPCIATADELLAIMDRYCIEEALVHEYHARAVYPLEDGNRRLMELIRGKPRLHPVWVLEPPPRPGRAPADRMVDDMLKAGVRAARLRPRAKGALPWIWDNLLGALEARRVPCFIDFGDGNNTLGSPNDQDVDALRTMAMAHPRLPMILSHVMGGLGVHPAIVPLIRSVPNLHLDITGILEYWRTVAHEVGPDRVFFATGVPFTDPGIPISNVQYAMDLDEKAKRMICGGNLRNLLKGAQ